MSSGQDKICMKKLLHRGNDDVFDLSSSSLYRRGWRASGGPRMSLDMPNMRGGSILLGSENKQYSTTTMAVNNNKEKKHKQPSSPGGRLASFLNSLFTQSLSSKKKKKSTKSKQSMKDDDDDDESPGGRRRRRSSISHFSRSSAATPVKAMSLPPSKIVKASSSSAEVADYSWLDEKTFQWDRKQRINYANGYLEKDHHTSKVVKIMNQQHRQEAEAEEKELRIRAGFDDQKDGGAESDSSSDLFELQNYDLGYDDSWGLPVYETTHMDHIKRPAAMVGSSTT